MPDCVRQTAHESCVAFEAAQVALPPDPSGVGDRRALVACAELRVRGKQLPVSVVGMLAATHLTVLGALLVEAPLCLEERRLGFRGACCIAFCLLVRRGCQLLVRKQPVRRATYLCDDPRCVLERICAWSPG